jgi:uncharacterized protein DUF6438
VTTAAAAGLLLFLAACAPRTAATPSGQASTEQRPASKAAITLSRSACFGRCPVYLLSVTPSGAVTYEGKAHVRVVGMANAQIAREKVDTLLSELDKAGYLTFANRYVSAEPACGRYVTDLPTVTTSATLRGRTKRIEHDYGCGSAPGALIVLERRIDEVLNSGRWTGR